MMTLYGYWRSSSSWRVRIVLAYKRIEYRHVPVNLIREGGEQRSEEHQQRNPMKQIPVLELADGRMLAESVAIAEYLESIHPTPAMFPRDPFERARVLEMVEMINSGIQPLQNMKVLQAVSDLGGDKQAWAARWIRAGLEALELRASQQPCRFLVGDHPTFADACLIPQLYNARRFGVELFTLERLLAVEAQCLAQESFVATHPDMQPDKPNL